MVGYFSMTLPAGMGLYWLANNVFTTATTYYLKELGGASTPVPKLERPKLKLGTAIRSAPAAEEGAAAATADGAAAMQAADVSAGCSSTNVVSAEKRRSAASGCVAATASAAAKRSDSNIPR